MLRQARVVRQPAALPFFAVQPNEIRAAAPPEDFERRKARQRDGCPPIGVIHEKMPESLRPVM